MVSSTIVAVERQVVDQIGDFKSLTQQAGQVQERFEKNISYRFDELLDKDSVKDQAIFSFENLTLVLEEELEVIVALEGMVNAARNEHLPVFISFNARLSSLFPRKRIDESSNPLDPQQIATAFQEAIRPIGLDAQNTLSVYRAFNTEVLKHLDTVLREANAILISSQVIPDLGMEGAPKGRQAPQSRNRPRAQDNLGSFGTVEEETFEQEDEEQPELFSIMQNLLHSEEPASKPTGSEGGVSGTPAPSTDGVSGMVPGIVPAGPDGQPVVPAGQQQYMIPAGMVPTGFVPADQANMQSGLMQPFQPQDGQQVEMVDQHKLMEILTNIQQTLKASAPQQVPGSIDDVERLDISQSLSEILKATAAQENVVSAVDRKSSDIINLVTLLFEAIWQDPSVPIPIKELIGRTQITIIKVALADTEFFNNETHPARAILNEFASAGIGWTEVDALQEDPLYQKIQALVERILVDYEDNNDLFDDLIADFRTFRASEAAQSDDLEQRILKADERNERLDDIHELVTQKLEERILGRELHPFVDELLRGPFHKFMVMLVLKEGPGGNAWKQAINTIDVLLWSVQPHEQEGDQDRLDTVNPRLLNNLRKAFRIASVEKSEIDELIEQLKLVQRETFHSVTLDILDEESLSDESSDTEGLHQLSLEEPTSDAQLLDGALADESATDATTTDDIGSGIELAKDSETSYESNKEGDEKEHAAAADPNPENGSSEKGTVKVQFLAASESDDKPTDAIAAGEPNSAVETHDIDTQSTDKTDLAVSDRNDNIDPPSAKPEPKRALEQDLPKDDPALVQVDNLSVGIWVEFKGEDEDQSTRCKLAAKINAIDKYIFVNRQGVKVVEKTRMGLARELRDGTVNIISDGLLFSRALESVIGNLRDSQHEQQTGSAYRPTQDAEG